MPTQRGPEAMLFAPLDRRAVVADFGEATTSRASFVTPQVKLVAGWDLDFVTRSAHGD
jgi:hypothetical protein